MAQTPKDKQSAGTPPQRRGWATALGEEAGAVARSALGRAGFDDPTLVLRWEEIAGAETARLTRPLKLSGDVLTLRAEPGATVFLQHESRPLCERINAFLGRKAVSRLRFVPGPVQARPRAKPRITAKPPVPTTDPAQKYEGPEGLREALLQLAQTRRTPH
jgi:hypothetical protein